jgi:hypothetical protein
VLAAYCYGAFVTWQKIEVPWWVEPPTIMAAYGLLHWVYTRHGWKWRLFGWRLSEMPDFGGTWFGELESSHGGGLKLPGMMYIHQTWTELSVEFDCQKSRSYSLMAVVNVTPGLTEGLTFEYTNAPRHGAKETMNAHLGLNHLRLSPDGKTLEGDYFSGRGRQTFGRMKLWCISGERMTYEDAEAAFKKLVKSYTNYVHIAH